jgi:hypothetical protein
VSAATIDLAGGAATIEYDPAVVSPDDLVGLVNGAPGMNGTPGQFEAAVAD